MRCPGRAGSLVVNLGPTVRVVFIRMTVCKVTTYGLGGVRRINGGPVLTVTVGTRIGGSLDADKAGGVVKSGCATAVLG